VEKPAGKSPVNASPVYKELDKAWKATCKVIFGREIGELAPYGGWLSELNPKLSHAKSSLTGKEIVYAITDYCQDSKRASLDEIWQLKKFPPLSINEIKDIDSLLAAVQERAYYTGNVILGNSNFIESSSNCLDSYFVLESGIISDSKYVCDSTRIKGCEYCFGSDGIGVSKFLIRNYEGHKNSRCLEAWKSKSCSDCHYVNGVLDSAECMFCFNVRSRKYAIGNLALEKGKYMSVKARLMEELAQMLEKEKSLPSMLEIVEGCKGHSYKGMLKELKGLEKIEKPDLSKVQAAFDRTCNLVLGKKIGGIDDYQGWLREHVIEMEVGKSIISGKNMLLADYCNYLAYPRPRLVTLLEAEFIGDKIRADKAKIESLTMESLEDAIAPVAYLTPEYFVGENENVIECSTQYSSINAYRSPGTSFSKNTAYSFWPRTAESIFGSSMAFESYYCINCYYSENLNRCMEIDSSKSCSDSFYLHNCENVNSSMFCFNAKNLNYAVGNTVVGKEQFANAREMLLAWAHENLAKKKSVPASIFGIGCKG